MSSPQGAPPSYAQATGSSTASSKPTGSRLEVPQAQNGIPVAARRSMEDERRPLPPGWIRQYDSRENHQFFVDTRANPPRSIWVHPYDDEEFLRSLDSEERERIQEEERQAKRPIPGSNNVTDDEGEGPTKLPPRPSQSSTRPHEKKSGISGFGKLKEKLTGMTAEERAQEKRRREKEEREYYQAHLAFRSALQKAQMTGQPQFLAKDRDGRDVYIEPPGGPGPYGNYGPNGYGYNPYSHGPYADPNARFIRPSVPYGRPYGGYYGGGYGLPIAGGLLGGMMLGGLLF